MSSTTIHGIYRDRLRHPSGEITFDSGWHANAIVLNCRVLLAGFLRNEPAMGIRYLAIGQGKAGWDTVPEPLPDPNVLNKLADNAPVLIPHGDLVFAYLNPDETPAGGATNRIQITATLGANKPWPAGGPPYPLREFGLFGELNGQPYMIDYVRHPLIEKDGSLTLERRIRLLL